MTTRRQRRETVTAAKLLKQVTEQRNSLLNAPRSAEQATADAWWLLLCWVGSRDTAEL